MSPNLSRHTTLWRASLALLVIAIGGFSMQPNPSPDLGSGWDKLDHFASFAALAIHSRIAFPSARQRVVGAWLLAYGGAIELAQTQVPGRSADWADWLADAVGLAIGLALWALWPRKK